MAATYEFYLSQLQVDTEQLTIVIVSGAHPALVAEIMGIDLTRPEDDPWDVDGGIDFSAYALLEVPGGVIACEHTGYADPSVDTLVRLSRDGRRAAVVRSNIQAHERFGAARDGELLFDDDEYVYIEDLDRVPDELRPIFDLAWVDLDSDDDGDGVGPVPVAMAMAETVTCLEVTAEHLRELTASTYYRARSQVYFE